MTNKDIFSFLSSAWSQCVVMLVMSFFIFSCASGPKEVLNKAENATFIIYTFDEHGSPAGNGSGFFIDKNGTGITNYHVLNNSMKAVIKLKDGKEYEVDKVLASDKKWDIAKFSIRKEEKEKFSFLKFSNSDLEQGDKVYNLGAPLGLEQTFADGLISSIRSDSHGQVAQVTIPISPGSSGSPIMNEAGDVVAVATFKSLRGENLNFGVQINEERLSMMTQNPFDKENRQFNNKEGFVILNIQCGQNKDLVLNALQFKSDATIAYFSYTNLDMMMNGSSIWCTTGKGDEGFYIEDEGNGEKYYVVSSDIGTSREEPTNVPLATVCKFQVNFPAMDKNVRKVTVADGGNVNWTFPEINLTDYRKSIKVDLENYNEEYAYSTLREGEFDMAQQILEGILEDDPENIRALNALGIISYVIDNNQDAIKYFSDVIEHHPNATIGYLNRSCVYKYQGETEKAISDVSKAIGIDKGKPELYIARADLYAEKENWQKAKDDLAVAIGLADLNSRIDLGIVYYKKGLCEARLGNNILAESDLRKALQETSDAQMKEAIMASIEQMSPTYEDDDSYASEYGSSYFTGKIGQFPVTMFLMANDNGSIQGWYYYNNKGAGSKFSLSGRYDNEGHIVINEYTGNGNNTGRFEGYVEGDVFKGTFSAIADSKTYVFYLKEM